MLARTIVQTALNRLHDGSLTVVEKGRTRAFGPGGDLAVTVTVHDERFWPAVLRKGSVGLGEAYAERWYDVDDLAGLYRIAYRNLRPWFRVRDAYANRTAPVRDLFPARSRGKDVDRDHISAHYDVSNDFFELMLDPTMAYSCGLFDRPGMTLEEAQEAKFDRLFDLLDLGPEDHLLEIGTGWGGLAVHAALRRGCRVTTTTISAEQHDYAAKRVAQAGLTDQVTVLDVDYRDLTGTYDKVVSVEMIEAVDWRDHATFFSTLADRARPGGLVALQAIVIDDACYEWSKRHEEFIKKFIFPGGCLPSVTSIVDGAADTLRLRPLEVHQIGQHYAETLRRWQANVDDNRHAIEALGFDDRFQRIWDMYLQCCIAAYEERHVRGAHIVLEAT